MDENEEYTENEECTCESEIIEEHVCPLKAEIEWDLSLCRCCEVCESNCTDDI